MYNLINGKTAYKVVSQKKTTHGITAIIQTPGGNWVVANGVHKYSPFLVGCEDVYGDWDHGHYFMEDKAAAIRYYEGVI